ncbi:Heterogeneous nuclear ribonucleoprotein 1 [Acorus gramineus]|uniref:Heterogeneous nuclear ribonucleoprotein 1 n=1 Tax=Acorus gramineus TaxID=55184 RepID=A0AAV9AFT7_ACOGR|nr:Heterogeneous nuclear ribonucleoprotein 1 [Acorus gramineus]
MSRFGEVEDCLVLKEWITGWPRGYGFVAFASVEDAKTALASRHILGSRNLEVKIAKPREEMKSSEKEATRIFINRIPNSVTEAVLQSHFEVYGEIEDLYMPKEPVNKAYRGIGFISFKNSDSVDTLMTETHTLGGSVLLVDRAFPKDENARKPSRGMQGQYGLYNAYITPVTRYAAHGALMKYDSAGLAYGIGVSGPSRGMGKKLFVGKLPQEASSKELRQYFGKFGQITDVYVPKDLKKAGHRGFGFVTFAEDGAAYRVFHRAHEILGQKVRIDSAIPRADSGANGSYMEDVGSYGGYGGPMHNAYSRVHESLDFIDWSYRGCSSNSRLSHMDDWRYRPY